MLTGKQLGDAIRTALEMKKKRPADLATHFHVRPPSVQGWLSKGTISKSKLPELWNYFSDVVGPEHWGMKAWPTGPVPGELFERPTEEEIQLLNDFRILTDDDQEHFRKEIAGRAQLLRGYLERHMKRLQPPSAAKPMSYSDFKTAPAVKRPGHKKTGT